MWPPRWHMDQDNHYDLMAHSSMLVEHTIHKLVLWLVSKAGIMLFMGTSTTQVFRSRSFLSGIMTIRLSKWFLWMTGIILSVWWLRVKNLILSTCGLMSLFSLQQAPIISCLLTLLGMVCKALTLWIKYWHVNCLWYLCEIKQTVLTSLFKRCLHCYSPLSMACHHGHYQYNTRTVCLCVRYYSVGFFVCTKWASTTSYPQP